MRFTDPKIRLAILLLCLALLSILPAILPSYYLGLATKILIFAIFAMSLDLLVGYSGLASLGHAGYFGVAAYVTGILAIQTDLGFWLIMPLSIIASALTAAVFAYLALRTRGSYFLMITLALAQVLWGVAVGWRSLTGGEDGLPDIPRPDLGSTFSMTAATPFYYFVLVFFALSVLILSRIVKSPFGYSLQGTRESETRMNALGFNVWRYRFVTFVIAASFAGLAGCLYAYLNRFVGPDYLHVARSAEVLLMVILGGAGTLFGPVVGAAVIVLLENIVSGYTDRWLIILGIIYVVVSLLAPNGIVGLIRSLKSRAQH